MRRCSVQDTKNYSVPTHPLSWWALKSPTRSATWVIENRSFLDPTQPAIMEIYPPTDLLDWSIAGAGRRAHTGVRWVYFHNSTLLKKWAVRAAASSASREGGGLMAFKARRGLSMSSPVLSIMFWKAERGPAGGPAAGGIQEPLGGLERSQALGSCGRWREGPTTLRALVGSGRRGDRQHCMWPWFEQEYLDPHQPIWLDT